MTTITTTSSLTDKAAHLIPASALLLARASEASIFFQSGPVGARRTPERAMSGPSHRNRAGPRAWLAALLLGGAALAHGAAPDQACGQYGCGAAHVDPAAVRAALRSMDAETARTAREGKAGLAGGPAAASPAARAPGAAGVWERRLGGPGAREEYDCALSFGVGGSLGGDGFLASRLLGRTRVWRGE